MPSCVCRTTRISRIAPLAGFRIDKAKGEVRYSTTFVSCGSFDYIPVDTVRTKRLSKEEIESIDGLLGTINWAVRPVADPSDLVIIQKRYETDYRLTRVVESYTAHAHGPNGIGSQYDQRWARIYDIIRRSGCE